MAVVGGSRPGASRDSNKDERRRGRRLTQATMEIRNASIVYTSAKRPPVTESVR